MLFDVGQSYRLGGKPDKALTAYRSYLRTVPNAANRVLVEKRVAELELQVPLGPSGAPAPDRPVQELAPSTVPPAPALATPVTPASPPSAPAPTPIYRRPWVWGVAAGVLAGAVTAAMLATSSRGIQIPNTPLGNQRAF